MAATTTTPSGSTLEYSTGERTYRRPKLLPGQTVIRYITTTDHKVIGNLYFITSFVWFLLGGIMALLIRTELAAPGRKVASPDNTGPQLAGAKGHEPRVTKSARETRAQVLPRGGAGETSG
jgi:cytochrome c oxidase subunit 1